MCRPLVSLGQQTRFHRGKQTSRRHLLWNNFPSLLRLAWRIKTYSNYIGHTLRSCFDLREDWFVNAGYDVEVSFRYELRYFMSKLSTSMKLWLIRHLPLLPSFFITLQAKILFENMSFSRTATVSDDFLHHFYPSPQIYLLFTILQIPTPVAQ